MKTMLLKAKSQYLIFLAFIIGFSVPLIIPQYSEHKFLSKTEQLAKESLVNIPITSQSLDFNVMFQGEYPIFNYFDDFIIKRYYNFPVIRVIFNDSYMKHIFFQKYQNEILHIEPNHALPNSLNLIPTESSKNKIADFSIQDSTGASFLHSLGIMGNNTRIGIIDTGVYNHSLEFGSRIRGRAVFITKDRGYSENILDPNDFHGHGTHVAGLAAGATTGIAPGAEIYSAKVIHDFSVTGAGGGYGEETTSGLLDAIDYLVNNSVDVINISLGQYHNLATGLRDEVINYISKTKNIVFTVSAGNSGSSFGDRGTLNNPATALQCIAVTMADSSLLSVNPGASKGLKVDYSLKPDIIAPGVGINGPRNAETGYITRSGTSMAAPIIGGSAALLIDYLKSNNISYSAGTIKAALLAGARSLGDEVWKEGSGFVNITRSWEILSSAEIFNNTPNLIYLHPQKLPIDPYEVLFSGSSVIFNLTIISSRQIDANIIISSEISEYVKINNLSHIISHSYLLPINFTLPKTIIPQNVTGNILIENASLNIEFEVREPVIRVLFDESLNSIVPHGYGFSSDGPFEVKGDNSNTIGMFSSFVRYLSYENNYSVTPHVTGDISLTKLQDYDVLIMANPFSLISDVYMDWVEFPGTGYVSSSKETTESIYQFVNLGGGVLVLTAESSYYNISKLNNFLVPFNLEVLEETSENIYFSSFINHNLNFTDYIEDFPFWGNYIQVSGNYTKIIANYNDIATLASYEGPTGGRVLLYGSDLIFDNIGFSSYAYGGITEQNKVLAFNSVAWLAEGEYRTTISRSEFPLHYLVFITLTALAIIFLIFINKSKK